MDRPYVDLKNAAALLCCSRQNLYALDSRGVIQLVKIAGRTVVTRASLDRALAAARPFVHGARGPRRPARTLTSATL